MTNEDKITNIGVTLAVYYEDWNTPSIELIKKFRDELNELIEYAEGVSYAKN